MLDCKDEEELTFDLIKCKLISEYERKSKPESAEVEEESIMKFVTKKYCNFCKESGHIRKFCPKFITWLSEKKAKCEEESKESTNAIANQDHCNEFDDDFREEYLF